jgi:hypothetical protein
MGAYGVRDGERRGDSMIQVHYKLKRGAWKVRPGNRYRVVNARNFSRDFTEVLQQIASRLALHQFTQFADRLSRRNVRIDCCPHDFLGACDGLRLGLDPHPADHGIEGNEIPERSVRCAQWLRRRLSMPRQ